MPRTVVLDPSDLPALVTAVGAALDGGPAVAVAPVRGEDAVPEGTALVVRTSGSTGTPREVALSATALRASAAATHERLGGPGRWLLALPAHHVAGLQVLVRAHVGGRTGIPGDGERLLVAPPGPFTAVGFAAATAALGEGRRYVSLVPTQLHRLVAAASGGDEVGLDALRTFDAVLLGGAATPPDLLVRARAADVRVVTTYGMTETSGGCVYDGVPLPGVRARVVPATGTTSATGTASAAADGPAGARPGATGVVELGGPVLATAYLGEPELTAASFRTDPDGTRWFRTSDLGAVDPGGRLTVLGRADDVVVTGGVNVAPAAVEAVLSGLDGIGEVAVVGVPDPEWGQTVVAVVTAPGHGVAPAHGPDAAALLLAAARRRVTDRLGAPAAPRRLHVVDELPYRGPGKVDRAAVVRLAVGQDADARV